jgi:hypothetical protein
MLLTAWLDIADIERTAAAAVAGGFALASCVFANVLSAPAGESTLLAAVASIPVLARFRPAGGVLSCSWRPPMAGELAVPERARRTGVI